MKSLRADGRSRLLVAAALVLVVGFALFAAGRASAPEAGVRVVQVRPGEDQPPVDAGPGPAKVVDGLGVGFARTPAGAVAAATHYVVDLGGKRMFSPTWREFVYREIVADSAYHQFVAEVEPLFELIASNLGLDEAAAYDGSVLAVNTPLGYRIEDYTPNRASVTVWASGWIARPRGQQMPLRAGTTTVELAWDEEDWKLLGVSATAPLDPPMIDVPPAASVIGRMASFTPYTFQPAEAP